VHHRIAEETRRERGLTEGMGNEAHHHRGLLLDALMSVCEVLGVRPQQTLGQLLESTRSMRDAYNASSSRTKAELKALQAQDLAPR